jgi:hypothetical protein
MISMAGTKQIDLRKPTAVSCSVLAVALSRKVSYIFSITAFCDPESKIVYRQYSVHIFDEVKKAIFISIIYRYLALSSSSL